MKGNMYERLENYVTPYNDYLVMEGRELMLYETQQMIKEAKEMLKDNYIPNK